MQLGGVKDKTGQLRPEVVKVTEARMRRKLTQVGALLAPTKEGKAVAQGVLRKHGISGYRLQTEIHPTEGGGLKVRVVCIGYPERPQLDAMAEMSQWLEHPAEFGRAPGYLEVYDHRRLFWPPTNDERDVWLFRYRYEDEGGTPEEGVGMVGSVTFALFGETTAELPPEDIYALHCVWELQQRGDKRAAKERTAEAGRKLLGFPAR